MIVRLGDYVNIRTGKLDANASSDNGMYPFFTCSKEPLRIDTFSYECECVLVAGNGDLNVKYYNGKFDAYQRTYIIESNNHEILNVKYLFYFLDKYLETLRQQSIGGVIKYIKLGNIANAQFPLPELDKQRKITETLDKVSDLIAKRKQQLEKLDLLVKSRFIEMFGDPVYNTKHWDIVLLSSIFNISSSKRIYQNELVDSGIPFFRISDIIKKIHAEKCTPELFISVEKYDELKKQSLVPKPGDILITSRGTLGECYVISDNDKFYFQDGMISWLYNMSDKANVIYITELFKLSSFRKQIEIIPSGSTVNYLSIARLRQLNIMLPPIELQNRFSEFVKQTEKTKTIINQSLEKLETLKKALMQEYFG